MHSTHFIYIYMASDIWLSATQWKKTRCRHMGYSFQLTARVLLYAPSHRQDSTYHSLYVEQWLQREIAAQWVHPMKDRSDDPSHHERTLLPRWNISLPVVTAVVEHVCLYTPIMVDPLSYFSFQPVLHDWCNKGCGMCYPVCGFPLSLSEWSFTICLTPYNRK